MSKRRRRRQKRSGPAGDLIRFVMTLLLIAAAVLIVLYVAAKVRGITGSFLKPAQEETAESSQPEAALSIEGESRSGEAAGFRRDADGTLRYYDADGSFLSGTWFQSSDALYYADETGAVQTDSMDENGMRYRFSADGKLSGIRYLPSYQPEASTVLADYPSLVKTKRLWAFLQKEDRKGDFYAIMYKKTTEAMAYHLGGEQNAQYTGPYSLQIDGDMIYYLPYDSTSGEDAAAGGTITNRTLYRMKPGDTVRQIVAKNVDGYLVCDGTVWYESQGRLYHTDTAEDDNSKPPARTSDGSEVLTVSVSDGAAYLTDSEGVAITAENGEAKGRGFTYYLNADGTVRSVNRKTTVNTGGYTYYIQSDSAFGNPVSRMMRKDQSGNEEVISTEFAGSTENLRYRYETGEILAEYTDEAGRGRVIKLSKTGDVELLRDLPSGTGTAVILAIAGDEVLCMQGSGNQAVFSELSLSDTEPLAVSVDPVSVSSRTETAGETVISGTLKQETAAPAPTEATGAPAQSGSANVKKGEEQAAVIAGPDNSGAEIGNAPPA